MINVRKADIKIKQYPASAMYRHHASMTIATAHGYAILFYSLGTWPRARGAWACHVYGSSGKKLVSYRGARARGVARQFFEGRPINVL